MNTTSIITGTFKVVPLLNGHPVVFHILKPLKRKKEVHIKLYHLLNRHRKIEKKYQTHSNNAMWKTVFMSISWQPRTHNELIKDFFLLCNKSNFYCVHFFPFSSKSNIGEWVTQIPLKTFTCLKFNQKQKLIIFDSMEFSYVYFRFYFLRVDKMLSREGKVFDCLSQVFHIANLCQECRDN